MKPLGCMIDGTRRFDGEDYPKLKSNVLNIYASMINR